MALPTITRSDLSAPDIENWSLPQSIGLAVIVLVAIGLRTWGLDHAPTFDELFHVLAARSWLSDGTFCIADCLRPYTRGSAFTLMVAASFSAFGESIVTARIPSVVAGVLLVIAVFIWVRSYVSARAAFIAAGLCAVAPGLIGWSQISRFYAPQALLVWIGAALFWMGLEGRRRVAIRIGALGASMAALALSFQLQVSTLIAIAGMGIWFVGFLFVRRSHVSRRIQLVLVTTASLALLGIVIWPPSTLMEFWYMYRETTNLLHASKVDDSLFYHRWFMRTYSILYILFPLAILVSLVRKPAPSRFLATIFVVSFVAHSFGGFKGERLILYVFPFFYVLWAIALAEVVPELATFVGDQLNRLSWLTRRPRIVRFSAWGLVSTVLFSAVLSTEAAQTTLRLITVEDAQWASDPWYRGNTDWEAAYAELQPLADDVDVLLASASVKAIFYFGRSDASISRTQLYRSDGKTFLEEFWTDWRTGRPVISQPASLESVINCYLSGLILIEVGHWRNPGVVTAEMADAIETLAEEVPVARGLRAKAFVWRHDETAANHVCSPEVAGWRQQG